MVRITAPIAIRMQIKTVGNRGRFGPLTMCLGIAEAVNVVEDFFRYILATSTNFAEKMRMSILCALEIQIQSIDS